MATAIKWDTNRCKAEGKPESEWCRSCRYIGNLAKDATD